jgi:hypothetical protein
MTQLHHYVNGIGASPNTVHFMILMAAVKLIQAVGWGARGRSL